MEIYLNIVKKYWYYIALTVTTILIVYLINDSNGNINSSIDSTVSQDVAQEQKPSCSIYIDVSGAVNKPNVYCLQEGSLLIDAVKRAGGFKSSSYAKEYVQSNINLSQRLEPNQKVYIPFKSEFKYKKYKYDLVPLESGSEAKGELNNCVSLNTSTSDQLDALKGVGPSLAQKIIEGRPYKSIEDLNSVSGVGDLLFDSLKNSVCI